MGRPAKGTVNVETLFDGTKAFQLRFRVKGRREHLTLHERRVCDCGCGGGWTDRTAEIELENVMARVRAGVWEPRPEPVRAEPTEIPTFHVYAPSWLEAKIAGVLGDRPIDPNTINDYRWRLSKHLLPFFGEYRLDEIDAKLCLAFKAHKLREAADLRAAIAGGAVIRDKTNRRQRPLGPASIRKLMVCLAAILDEAVEDEHIDRNPARGRRMRVKVPKPARTFLEMDELVALIDAAADQDTRRIETIAEPRGGSAAAVAARWARGMRPTDIARELGLSKATVGFHLRRLKAEGPATYACRRAIVATLGGSGVRVSELCDIRIRELRLHAATGAHFRIPDAKSEAGIREVQVSPDLVDELVAHLDNLRRAGRSTEPDAFLFPNLRGGRMSRQRAAEIVGEAAALATERQIDRGLPALPNTTPHTLRRTYISVALLANRFDVLWVMSQVGHADSKMTMDVYAQLQQRVDRRHGQAFDALVRQARKRLSGSEDASLGGGLGGETVEAASDERKDPAPRNKKGPISRAFGMARPGLEPGTPRFSAARPPQANVAALQRNRKRIFRRRVPEDSRTFRAIAALSGTRSGTCARMTSEMRLRAPGRRGVARSSPSGVARA
jgi:integrase